MKAVLSFDLGTSSVKAALFTFQGECIRSHTISYSSIRNAGGISEQRPEDWWKSVCASSQKLMEAGAVQVCAIGLSGHSMGVVPLDVTGRLLLESVPIWNDLRAIREAQVFFEKVDQETWYSRTGAGLTPWLYAAFKLAWYKNHMPQMYGQTHCFLGTKDYINYRMTGVMCTDRSDASGSGAWALEEEQRISEYYDVLGVDESKLPRVVPSHAVIGELTVQAACELGLTAGIPVVAGGVDNACTCLGAGCWQHGKAYASLGTSAWVAASSRTPELDYSKGIYTFAHCVENMYVPAVGVLSAGSSLNWALDMLVEHNANDNLYERATELALQAPPGSNGILFLPTLAGGSAIDASLSMFGGYMNLSLATTRQDMIRATFEGISCEVALCFALLREKLQFNGKLLMVGGGSNSDFWMDLYAQIFHSEVYRTSVARNAAALGAAALALKGIGEWKDYQQLDVMHANGESFAVREEDALIYEQLRERFAKAMQAASQLNE